MKFALHVLSAALLAASGLAISAVAAEPPSPYTVPPPAPPPLPYQVHQFLPPPPPVADAWYPEIRALPEVPACAAEVVPCAGGCPVSAGVVAKVLECCPWLDRLVGATGIEIQIAAPSAVGRNQVVVIKGCRTACGNQVCTFAVAADGKCACGEDCCCAKKDCKCGKACQCAKKEAGAVASQCAGGKCGSVCSSPEECATLAGCPPGPCSPCGPPPCPIGICEGPCFGMPMPPPPGVQMGMMEQMMEVAIENAVLKARLEFLEEKQELYESLVEATVENAKLQAQVEQNEERLGLVQQVFEAGSANATLQARVAELERQLKELSSEGPRTAGRQRSRR